MIHGFFLSAFKDLVQRPGMGGLTEGVRHAQLTMRCTVTARFAMTFAVSSLGCPS